MSTIYSTLFRCVECSAQIFVRVADSLNANRLPEARQWVLDRTLFQTPCECGRTLTALHPFLYADFDRGLWIQVLLEDQRPRFRTYYFAPDEPGRILGDVVVPRSFYDALAARGAVIRDAYRSLFEGLYVNVQRYRFEPEGDGAPVVPVHAST